MHLKSLFCSKIRQSVDPLNPLPDLVQELQLVSSLDTKKIKDIISTDIISTDNIAIKKNIKEKEIGKEYWKLAMFLSLLFFAFEILLIKLIKL